MSIIYCSCCSEKIGEGEIRWAEEEAYCDDCFSELFTHCDHCDDVVRRSNAYFDDLGNAHCSNCWDEENDDECPDNPDVDDADRKLIVELSRSWLLGKQAKRCVMKYIARLHRLCKPFESHPRRIQDGCGERDIGEL